ncbi:MULTISPECIES: sensor domain-containing diguanylate cyclase [Geobacter]|uniref:sensor domain-containing diguanylate cyclase n=1 Tax=Geobacter TaxID=28231 RepID=UPI00257248A4|nr:sensor domain-containing diguanylate cyclase [Geobacter sulfurreducens]BEH11496.1 sensor domain-containing diguanylate cyclase [Geobacter sulfurreducens subsp. ethanolicus]BET59352.1 sensor domain-containing diguanylate cyclase [Geobacter sp. 60473]HML76800.1 sensor domain-containing diguanylate cyclase [Geobacter sulfurreducens]
MPNNDSFYKKVLDNLYDGIYFVDEQRRITYWNKGAQMLTGYGEKEVIGRNCHDIFLHLDSNGNGICSDACPIEKTITDGRKRDEESFLHHKDGHLVPVCLRVAPIQDTDGQMVVAVEVTGDHSPRHALRQQLENLQRLALCDPLTTIANRRYVEMSLNSRLEEMRRYGWHFGILFLDVDHFKQINDTHGHDTGDRVLKMVAKTLVNSARSFDVVGRWGGEEFIAILANISRRQLPRIADRFRHLVEQSSFRLDDRLLRVTVSVGATMSHLDDTVESLVQRADTLMYRSKEAGRNCVSIGFGEEMPETSATPAASASP